jgi:DNA (cytosine-5)-methyltransferase 1
VQRFTSVELCAGAGGQALGLHEGGFDHLAMVELDETACQTLRHNAGRLGWPDGRIYRKDLRGWVPSDDLIEVDLVAGGVPCPPFSVAGRQLGEEDERDLFPALIEVVRALKPRAVQVENVRGLLGKCFESYRRQIEEELGELDYVAEWQLLNACDFGVPQLRPRTILVALRGQDKKHFKWPKGDGTAAPTVGEVLLKSMRANGWKDAEAWAERADQIAPTLVGGSRKHGGPDLGPTRARRAWARLGVDGLGLADAPPAADFTGTPKLTVAQAALLQGFPPDWEIQGRKTAAYRQVGNAFPPPVAAAVGSAIRAAFEAANEMARRVTTQAVA